MRIVCAFASHLFQKPCVLDSFVSQLLQNHCVLHGSVILSRQCGLFGSLLRTTCSLCLAFGSWCVRCECTPLWQSHARCLSDARSLDPAMRRALVVPPALAGGRALRLCAGIHTVLLCPTGSPARRPGLGRPLCQHRHVQSW